MQRLEANPYRTESRPYVVIGVLAERRFGRFRLFLNAENIGDTRQTRWDSMVRPAQESMAAGPWTRGHRSTDASSTAACGSSSEPRSAVAESAREGDERSGTGSVQCELQWRAARPHEDDRVVRRVARPRSGANSDERRSRSRAPGASATANCAARGCTGGGWLARERLDGADEVQRHAENLAVLVIGE